MANAELTAADRQPTNEGTPESQLAGPGSSRGLKWATVALPLAFVAVISYVSHFLMPHFTHSVTGFLSLMAIVGLGAFVFSQWVFSLVQRAEQRTLNRLQDLLLLKTVAVAASQPMKLKDLLQVAVDGVADAMEVDACMVCILDEKAKELLHTAYRGIPEHLLGPLKKVKLQDDPVGAKVVSTGEPVYIKDLSNDPLIAQGEKPHYFRSVLSVPMMSEGKVKGVMVLANRSTLVLEPSRGQSLLTLGAQLAVAIERTQLQQQVASMAVMEERERIAREMHDGLAQVLGYINAKTSAISRLMSDGDIEDAQLEIGGLREAARDLYTDVRESILSLRLAGNPASTLADSLRACCDNLAVISGISVALSGVDNIKALDMDVAVDIQVRRIIQEALTNVRKHAQAGRVTLSVERDGKWLSLRVEDDGTGFDTALLEANGRHHFGIQTMRERAASVGGKLQVESRPGSGTKVTVTVPLQVGQGEA